MSAFAVLFDRSGAPVDPAVFENTMRRLAHRGPDGSDSLVSGRLAMGHWHFWTVPEEVDEVQPLRLDDLPFRIVFDGRIDNRADLLSALGLPVTDPLSDAALLLRAYARWGADLLPHLVGEFALVIFDPLKGELLCARDPLGDRTLFHAFHSNTVVIASEAWAAAAACPGAEALDDEAAAHFFAIKPPADGRTFFSGVFELLPAHAMTVGESAPRTWRYWQPDPSRRTRFKTDVEYGTQFRILLEEAVRSRLRTRSQPGILMSGGLDSTSVASLAARMLAPQPLTAVSYVFDELKDADERVYMEAMSAQYGIRLEQVPCDDAWPLRDWPAWPFNPNYPEGNPYRILKNRTYARAQQAGLRVLLTGGFGDHLYGAGPYFLADLLADGRIGQAAGELAWHVRTAGLGWTLRSGFLQNIARRSFLSRWRGRGSRRSAPAAPWLTPSAAGFLAGYGERLDPVFKRHGGLLGLFTALGNSSEVFHNSRFSVELRHPFRDRRLVEYILSIPAYQLYTRGRIKAILRTAMQGLLPEIIRTRPTRTSIESLFVRGMQREETAWRAVFADPQAAWRPWVRADWVEANTPRLAGSAPGGEEEVALWLCLAYEAWRKRRQDA